MTETEERRCPECGETFVAGKRSRKICCSVACSRRNWKKNNPGYYHIVCDVCGKEFTHDSYCKRYCSPECAAKGKKLIKQGKLEHRKKSKKSTSPKRKKVDKLAIDAAEARAHGMTYGQWMAQKYIKENG